MIALRRIEVSHFTNSCKLKIFVKASLCRRWKSTQSNKSEVSKNGTNASNDPRFRGLGNILKDEFATIRQNYKTPKYPIVLAHGLLGFDELHLAGPNLPGIQYWRGITDALRAKGVEVVTASVSASGSIESRAEQLSDVIEKKVRGKSVNIIGHSMVCIDLNNLFQHWLNRNATKGGLDSRYMISRLKQPNVKVLSLTTIATPHNGSAFADYVLNQIGPIQLPKVYKFLEFFGIETGAFSQLTQNYMQNEFNPKVPDLEGVRYYSYGATFDPSIWSTFRQSHHIIERLEGPNDGLVSVNSSQWGDYKGTLVGVSHLDLINWTNRLRWFLWQLTGNERNFNAIAFYLDIADMLAREGL